MNRPAAGLAGEHPAARRRKRRVFGPLTWSVLVLVPFALYWKYVIGGYAGVKRMIEMRAAVREVRDQRFAGIGSGAAGLVALGPESRAVFFSLLSDVDPKQRQAGVEGLTMSLNAEELLEALEPLWDDPSPQVRILALSACAKSPGELITSASGALSRERLKQSLIEEWNRNEFEFRDALAESIARLGSDMQPAGVLLATFLLDPDSAPRLDPTKPLTIAARAERYAKFARVFETLAVIDPKLAEQVGQKLLDSIKGADFGHQDEIESRAWSCFSWKDNLSDPRLRERMSGMLESGDASLRLHAGNLLLRKRDRFFAQAEQALLAVALDPNGRVVERSYAAQSLQRVGSPGCPKVWRALTDLLEDAAPADRLILLNAILEAPQWAPIPISAILALKDDPDPAMRIALFSFFDKHFEIDAPTKAVVIDFAMKGIQDPESPVLDSALHYLSRRARDELRLLPQLLKLHQQWLDAIVAEPPLDLEKPDAEKRIRRQKSNERLKTLAELITQIDKNAAAASRAAAKQAGLAPRKPNPPSVKTR